VVAPETLIARWEAAYRQYTEATRLAGRANAGDRAAAEALASTSWAVATTWRDLATTVVLPWWALAALRAAAEAFEAQARTWHTRAIDSISNTSRRNQE
jgi:hypothetical protein